MTNYKDTSNAPKPPAASHMLWFFIIPAIAFMGWVSWTLLSTLNEKPEQSSLIEKASEIKSAKSAGARYQAAYGLAQELQKGSQTQNAPALSEADKDFLFAELGSLLSAFPEDDRLRRYLILTLAQLKDPRSLPVFASGVNDKDSDIKFYSAWGLVETLSKYPKERTPEHTTLFVSWLSGSDPAYKKIATSYLVHFPEHQEKILALLKDENKEVQWNTAVALASQKNAAGKKLIEEMLQLHTIRTVNFRSSQDLQQFVATALEATINLKDKDLAQAALELKSRVLPNTTEGRAVFAAFDGAKIQDLVE